MKNLKIMVVDDSTIMILTITKILKELGYNVVATARTGIDAINKHSIFKPDIITMDITMPDLSGVEAVKGIINIDPKALIIMVTSQGQEQLVLDSIYSGAKAYILKPFSPERLKETIEGVYEKYSAE
jgi:two-component system chemotaxis response regulator CheY